VHLLFFLALFLTSHFLELDSIDIDIVLLPLDSLILAGQPIVALGIGSINFLGGLGSLDTFFGLVKLRVAETHVEPGIFIVKVLFFQILLVVLDGLLVLLVLEALVAPILLVHGFLIFIHL
jgi:hypothetical protein